MSFILDALRKSEHERQRQTGPALVETPVAATRSRPNRWATAAIALLLVNLVAIGVLLLYKSRGEPPIAGAIDTGDRSMPSSAPSASPGAQAALTRTVAGPALPPAPPPMLQPAQPPAASPGTRNPLAGEMASGGAPVVDEALPGAAGPRSGPPAVTPTQRGSVVYESLPDLDPLGRPQGAAPAPRGSSGLPTADEFAPQAGLPEMRLELHVYSVRPQDRFVFINGSKYREGEGTQQGATVEEITPDGVVLSARGSRFLLPRD